MAAGISESASKLISTTTDKMGTVGTTERFFRIITAFLWMPKLTRKFVPAFRSFRGSPWRLDEFDRRKVRSTMARKQPEPEVGADLTAWATGVASAVTAAELARLIKDYREQARNSRRSAADREFAKRRGNALAQLVKRNS